MTDLDKLLEAVEAGTEWISVLAAKVFPPQQAVDACKAYGHEGQPGTKGSLDAARSLHDALLPGWGRDVDATAPECGTRVTLHAPMGWPRHPDDDGTAYGDLEDEARSWLLAILRAVKAKGEQG